MVKNACPISIRKIDRFDFLKFWPVFFCWQWRHIASHYAWQEMYSKNEIWFCMVAFFPYISSSNYKRKHNGWNKIPLHRRAHNKRLHAFRPGVIFFLYRSLTHVSASKIKALRLFQWRVGITSITLEKSIRVAILSFCNLVKHLH